MIRSKAPERVRRERKKREPVHVPIADFIPALTAAAREQEQPGGLHAVVEDDDQIRPYGSADPGAHQAVTFAPMCMARWSAKQRARGLNPESPSTAARVVQPEAALSPARSKVDPAEFLANDGSTFTGNLMASS